MDGCNSMTTDKTISLIMPTYNRGHIINLAIKSIIHQQSYSSELELIIGDDGNDSTEEIVNGYKKNTNIKIIYKQFDRIALSDKINKLIELSSGDYYGIIGSDDIQSPYKISAFEKSLLKHPNAKVFGQQKFIYHDIVYGNSTLWTQNKSLDFFKAGSFVIVNREIFDQVNGYENGLWKRIDKSFYKKVSPLNPEIVDVSTIEPLVTNSSIALQHIDNIWDRNAKGLASEKPQQLSNFYSEPINLNIKKEIPDLFNDYTIIRKQLVDIYKKKFPIKYFWRNLITS